MMKRFGRNIVVLAVVIAIAVVAVVAFILSGNSAAKGPHTEYQCDVKSISLSTKIDIAKEGEDFAKVRGNLFRFVTDPLTMYDLEDNKIAYAGDAYHFIAQDSHSINVGDTVTAEMVGLVDFFGESYDIYNADEEQVAKISFNMFNTKGEMYDMDGNIIADFYSKLFFNDFTVRIYEECELDENTVLMIFSSYYSDQKADSSTGGSSSSSKSSKWLLLFSIFIEKF